MARMSLQSYISNSTNDTETATDSAGGVEHVKFQFKMQEAQKFEV
jgi:hypothetical protein